MRTRARNSANGCRYCSVVGFLGWLGYSVWLFFVRRKGRLDYVAQTDVELDQFDDDAIETTDVA